MISRSLYAAMLGTLMVSTSLSCLPVYAQSVSQAAPASEVTQALSDALKQAASYGSSSFIASVYENARLTPFRADAIRSEALSIAPDLSREIQLATDMALSQARPDNAATVAVTDSASAVTRPPGAERSTDLNSIPEFQRNWGLGLIGTQAALDRNFTGKGVVVGVVDSGIDRRADGTPHPEFAGRIDPRSASLYHWFDANLAVQAGDVNAGFNRPADASDDGHGHGTHVAGIIGAARDGQGMHGVAPGATLLTIGGLLSLQRSQYIDSNYNVVVNGTTYNAMLLALCGADYLTNESLCRQASSIGTDTTDAIAYLATQRDVRVINGSFGPSPAAGATTWNTGDLTAQANAVRASLNAGQIITMAAGNERGVAPVYGENPSGIGLYPFMRPSNATALNSAGQRIYTGSENADFSDMTDAALTAAEAADGIKRGRIIVVVATDSQKVIADYSNYCGVAAEWCLAAPGGHDDQRVERLIYSTYPVNGYHAMQGTSMAAPHVAGAIAVLIEAFPTYTPAQIVNILFETAEDLGEAGTDRIYGRGFLRLDRALNSGPAGLNPNDTGEYVAGAGGARGDRLVWSTPINSSGSFSKQGQGMVVVAGNANFARGVVIQEGELRVDGNLGGGGVTVGNGGTLSGNGTINANLTSNGNLSPGQSPGLLTVNGNLTLGSQAQTNIEVDGLAAQVGAGGFDRIAVTGSNRTATVAGVLAPLLRGISGSANNNFTPSLGHSFKFLDVANGQVVGTFASLLQPTSGLAANTRFDVVYGASSLTLATTPVSYANLRSFGVTQSAAARGVGGAIDAARPAAGVRPSDALQALFSNLYLSDATGLASGLEQATGQIYVDAGQSAVLSVGRFADGIWQHQTELSLDGAPAGDRARFWTQGGRWFGDHDGYEADSAGATFGMDIPLDTGWVGGAFRYEGTDIAAGTHGNADINTYHASLYGQAEVAMLELSGRAGLTYGELDVSRRVSFGVGTASLLSSDDKGMGGFVEATVQKTLAFGETKAIPSLTFGYRAFGFDGTTEAGAYLPLTTPNKTFEEGHITAALTVSHRFDLANEFHLTPMATVGYRRDLLEISNTANARVLGTNFTTSGQEIGRDAFVGGIKLQAGKGDRITFAAGYDVELRKGVNQHRVSGSLNIRW